MSWIAAIGNRNRVIHQAIADLSLNLAQLSDQLSTIEEIYQPKCVKFSNLTFYETVKVLIGPVELSSKNLSALSAYYQQELRLTSQEVNDICQSCYQVNGKNIYNMKVLVRFALENFSCTQPDIFPNNLNVCINNVSCNPYTIVLKKHQAEYYHHDSPLDITSLLKLFRDTSNKIEITWKPSSSKYVVAVYLVKTLTSDDLFTKLAAKDVRSADYTRSAIKRKFKEDSEIVPTAVEMSLICPLTKKRIVTPCLSTKCDHLQCFDAENFLKMNEKSTSWKCPICDSFANFDHLIIDDFFKEILSSNKLTGDDIRLLQDGSWENSGNKKAVDLDATIDVEDNDTILIDSEIDDSGIIYSTENISSNSTDDFYGSLPSTSGRRCYGSVLHYCEPDIVVID